MFKNMSPKMRIVTIVAIIVVIALIVFFAVRHKKNKKKAIASTAEDHYAPIPAEGGEFRVVPQEDETIENTAEAKPEATEQRNPQVPKQKAPPANGQQRPAQQQPKVTQKSHLNTSGRTRGGALPPMDEDLSSVPEHSNFAGNGPSTPFEPVVVV